MSNKYSGLIIKTVPKSSFKLGDNTLVFREYCSFIKLDHCCYFGPGWCLEVSEGPFDFSYFQVSCLSCNQRLLVFLSQVEELILGWDSSVHTT